MLLTPEETQRIHTEELIMIQVKKLGQLLMYLFI